MLLAESWRLLPVQTRSEPGTHNTAKKFSIGSAAPAATEAREKACLRGGKEAGPPKIAATHLSLQNFVQSVRKPNGQMPPFGSKQVTDNELSDVYAFLQSVASQPKLEPPSSANSQNGQHLYTTFGCYECHGYQGQGSVQTGGSRIGPPQIPYSGFVAYVRQPTGQMPPYTLKAASDAQLADIYVFLQSRPQSAPSKSIPLLSQ